MPTGPSLATIAEYFRLGLQVGLLLPEHASAWATSVLAALDSPPYEIIEVSWSKGLASTLDALSAVPGERDKSLAGRWLLGLLRESIPDSEEGLQLAARRAMQIARDAELGDETYYRFDMVDDELSLARNKIYGTVEQCRIELLRELTEYPVLGSPNGA
jgi:hypothetical protein